MHINFTVSTLAKAQEQQQQQLKVLQLTPIKAVGQICKIK
jgi:hypothetical protein